MSSKVQISFLRAFFIMFFYCCVNLAFFAGFLYLANEKYCSWIEGANMIKVYLSFILIMTLYIVFTVKGRVFLQKRLEFKVTDAIHDREKNLVRALLFLVFASFIFIALEHRYCDIVVALPEWLKCLSLIGYIGSFIVLFLSFSNKNLAVVVTKQSDQGLCSTGIYSLIRHPMYSGGFAMMFFMSIYLESISGFVLSLIMFIVLMARIKHEEEFLINNVKDYKDYMKKVPCRLSLLCGLFHKCK